MVAEIPRFETVLKSRAVEDPVNLWVNRPLAYAFVMLVYRTRITPNQVTLISLLVGIAAAVCFVLGSSTCMVIGGILLWASAILDGADGILARAKRLSSEAGRAIDGIADAIVAATTVGAVFFHIWETHREVYQLLLMPFALATAVVHIYTYDYYKESFLMRTRPDWDGKCETSASIAARLQRLIASRASRLEVGATRVYLQQQAAEAAFVKFTNPAALRTAEQYPVSETTVQVFRKYNTLPMKLWAANSLAPHSYTMSICAMLDRLDAYLYIRVVLANVLYVVTLFLQHRATRLTNQELRGVLETPL
ncbi:MAG TPA: CDP-alcohol phosphatidyltransferase family protein [Polyangiales bacterium]|nr:CDP-alcohol phosphatidyltransferase family protein [Polyangiales bacterium]